MRCGAAASAVMSYSYAAREVWLDDISGSLEPGSDYAFCGEHAGRMSAPRGWTLADRRKAVRLFAPLEVA